MHLSCIYEPASSVCEQARLGAPVAVFSLKTLPYRASGSCHLLDSRHTVHATSSSRPHILDSAALESSPHLSSSPIPSHLAACCLQDSEEDVVLAKAPKCVEIEVWGVSDVKDHNLVRNSSVALGGASRVTLRAEEAAASPPPGADVAGNVACDVDGGGV